MYFRLYYGHHYCISSFSLKRDFVVLKWLGNLYIAVLGEELFKYLKPE